jgi:hypothetical protein
LSLNAFSFLRKNKTRFAGMTSQIRVSIQTVGNASDTLSSVRFLVSLVPKNSKPFDALIATVEPFAALAILDLNAGLDCPGDFVDIRAVRVGILNGEHNRTVEGSAGNADQTGKVSVLARFDVVADEHVNCAFVYKGEVLVQGLEFACLVALGLRVSETRADDHGLERLVD